MLLFRTGNDRKLLALICAMYLEYQKKPVHWQSLITSYLGFLFVYLLRDHQEHLITAPESSAYDPSLQIFQYIQAHYDTVTLEMLCENFSYTAAYLSRLIKKKIRNDLFSDCHPAADRSRRLASRQHRTQYRPDRRGNRMRRFQPFWASLPKILRMHSRFLPQTEWGFPA